MNRRDAIKQTALIMGAAVSSSVAAGILNGCQPKPGITWNPVFFTEDQAILITRLTDVIIPTTDTPGAKEVGVPAFIEEMVRDVYSENERARFMAGLDEFSNGSTKEYGNPFNDLNAEDQLLFITAIHSEAIKAKQNSNGDVEKPFIMMVKELTVLGFFTSQVGAEQVLQYSAVPGVYRGCISLEEAGGKTWAS